MRKSLFAIALAAGLAATPAFAADLPSRAPPPVYVPPPPIFTWTGFYIGVDAGGVWGHTNWQYTTPPFATANQSSKGALAGGLAGYNYQVAPNWVIGVEADFGWSSLNGIATCPNPAFGCQARVEDFGTARARVGYALDRWLIYGTGGASFGEVNVRTINNLGVGFPPSGTPINGSSSFRVGWTAGAGVEYAIWNNVSVKVEYLHFDLGGHDFPVDSGLVVHAHEFGDLVRAGVNWRFDWAPPPPPPAPVVAKY